jgi:hypothetical protein
MEWTSFFFIFLGISRIIGKNSPIVYEIKENQTLVSCTLTLNSSIKAIKYIKTKFTLLWNFPNNEQWKKQQFLSGISV